MSQSIPPSIMKQLFSFLFAIIFIGGLSAQSKWSIQASAGGASETNLGDTGLRLSTKVERNLVKRLGVFAQVGAFQMFRSNEHWEGDEAFREERALSTANIDLGLSYSLVATSRFRLGVQVAGAYRAGRQLWPEREVVIQGDPEIFYTREKISEAGYVFGLNLDTKVSEKVWIGLDAHCHNYNYFKEYLGVGLGAIIRI